MLLRKRKADPLSRFDDLLADEEFWRSYERTIGRAVFGAFTEVMVSGALAGRRLVGIGLRYSPDQPRDESGRFGESTQSSYAPARMRFGKSATAVGLHRLPPAHAAAVVSAVNEFQKQYPDTRFSVMVRSGNVEDPKFDGSSPNSIIAYTTWEAGEPVIRLNESKLTPGLDDYFAERNREGYTVIANTKDLITHELGHVLATEMSLRMMPGPRDRLPVDFSNSARYDISHGKAGLPVSEYSSSGVHEDFAENFVVMQNFPREAWPERTVYWANKLAAVQNLKKKDYNPDQPRDDAGRWTDGGGGFSARDALPPHGFITETQARNAREWAEKYGLKPEKLEANAVHLLQKATPEQWKSGLTWYKEAHNVCADNAATYGTSGDVQAAVMAVLSPQTDWSRNAEAARAVNEFVANPTYQMTEEFRTEKLASMASSYRMNVANGADPDDEQAKIDRFVALAEKYSQPTPSRDIPAEEVGRLIKTNALDVGITKAVKMLRGEATPAETVAGIKVTSFYNNMNNPDDSRSVTIDTHMINGLTGGERAPDGVLTKVFSQPAAYMAMAAPIYKAAEQHGITPMQAQAIGWMSQTGRNEGAGVQAMEFKENLKWGSWIDPFSRAIEDDPDGWTPEEAQKHKYSPDQPRDEGGRFTDAGGGGGSSSGGSSGGSGSSRSPADPPGKAVAGALAKSLSAKAKSVEPKITKDMDSIVGEHDGRLAGLDFRLKSEESLARKIKDEAEAEGVPYEAKAAGIIDAVRYTAVFSPEKYVEGTEATLQALEDKGYTVDKFKNYWEPGKGEAMGYRGVNTVLTSPDGQKLELQFHTAASLAVKEPNHLLYQEARKPETDQKTREALIERMNDRWETISAPIGIDGLAFDTGS